MSILDNLGIHWHCRLSDSMLAFLVSLGSVIISRLGSPLIPDQSYWLLTGSIIAMLIVRPCDTWLCISLFSIIGAGVGVFALGQSVALGAACIICHPFAALVGATTLRRLGNPRVALVPPRNVITFIAMAVIIGPACGALLWAGIVLASEQYDLFDSVQMWSMTAVGVLLLVPLVSQERTPSSARHTRETIALYIFSAIAVAVIFSDRLWVTQQPVVYLLLPSYMWAALRYGVTTTTRISLLISLSTIWLTAAEHGPFSGADMPTTERFFLLVLFLGVTATGALMVSSFTSELRHRAIVEAALREQTLTDPLTGLPNRNYFNKMVARTLDDPQTETPLGILAIVDIDRLKLVNDGFGHLAGDALIQGVAAKLHAAVRQGDIVTRISGDEFAILLLGAPESDARTILERMVTLTSEPIILEDQISLEPSISIGTATLMPGVAPEDLINQADTALYQAKRSGRGRIATFSGEMDRMLTRRQTLRHDVRPALESGHIYCVYQPQIQLVNQAVFGVEALARWQHPKLGSIGPDEFLPVIEKTGNAFALFETVLDQAIQQQRTWARTHHVSLNIAVNVSPALLLERRLVSKIREALERYDMSARNLWLEIVETEQIPDGALSTIDALRAMGCRIALDDFGVGWSSIERVHSGQWDMIKIDRSFINMMMHDNQALRLVRLMIEMGKLVGVPVTAEGVERADQAEYLRSIGCDIIQGYFYGHPMSAGQLIALIGHDAKWLGVEDARSGPSARAHLAPTMAPRSSDGRSL